MIIPGPCRIGFSALALVLVLLLSAPAGAADDLLAPLAIRNQSPLVQIHGLPADLNPNLPPSGRVRARLALDIANNFAKGTVPGEQILLDGESYRTTLALAAGLGKSWMVGLELPWVAHREGFLDGFLEDWHDALGLPQGGRDNAPRNRLAYRYLQGGVPRLALTGETSGLGDLALLCAWQMLRREGPGTTDLAFGSRLELPTGDADRLHGSGSVDLALWLAAGRRAPLGNGELAGHLALGVLAMSRGDVLASQQRPATAFGRIGLAWSPSDRLALKLQLEAHSSLYRGSDLVQVNSPAALLTMGGTIALPGGVNLDLGFSEDMVVEAASDGAFHLALNRLF